MEVERLIFFQMKPSNIKIRKRRLAQTTFKSIIINQPLQNLGHDTHIHRSPTDSSAGSNGPNVFVLDEESIIDDESSNGM